jgi:hypothetical protein
LTKSKGVRQLPSPVTVIVTISSPGKIESIPPQIKNDVNNLEQLIRKTGPVNSTLAASVGSLFVSVGSFLNADDLCADIANARDIRNRLAALVNYYSDDILNQVNATLGGSVGIPEIASFTRIVTANIGQLTPESAAAVLNVLRRISSRINSVSAALDIITSASNNLGAAQSKFINPCPQFANSTTGGNATTNSTTGPVNTTQIQDTKEESIRVIREASRRLVSEVIPCNENATLSTDLVTAQVGSSSVGSGNSSSALKLGNGTFDVPGNPNSGSLTNGCLGFVYANVSVNIYKALQNNSRNGTSANETIE